MENTTELLHLIHTPEELTASSNLAHNIEGVILLFVALTFLFKKPTLMSNKVRPALLTFSGAFLIGFIFLHHPSSEWPIIVQILQKDRQQFQHFLIAVIALIGGIGEYFGQKKENILTISFPAVVTAIGVIFLMHPQHGTSEAAENAVILHEYIGALFVASGFFYLVYKLFNNKWVLYLATFILIIVSFLLIIYREPEGAYHTFLNGKINFLT